MTAGLATDEDRVVGLVGDFFEAALTCLSGWRDDLAADLAAVDLGRLTVARLDELVRPYAAATLSDPAVPAYGAGFVAAIDLLPELRQHLSWWQGPGHDKLVLASRSLNKEQLDYSEFEWYRVPLQTGRAHVAGPSVDYLCCDEYTMTAALPVLVDGRFVGIAGLDLLVDDIERHLAPLLRHERDTITLVNDLGRVIYSTDLRLETGASVRGRRSRRSIRRRRFDALPLTLLVG